MTRSQIISIIGSGALLLVLYFGFDTKPKSQKELERSRALMSESTDINVLLTDARETLGPFQVSEIMAIEDALNGAPDDSARVELLKSLSGKWYEHGFPVIAGFYAQRIAELLNTEESWSIAGTTYSIGLQRATEARDRSFATERAVRAFENAISLNPENLAHQVNLALVYTTNPPSDNPMRGITMLLDLNQKHPESVLVLNNLARLAIQTGQYDRAVERLEKVLAQEPGNRVATCLLSEAYAGAGEAEKAAAYARNCRELNQ